MACSVWLRESGCRWLRLTSGKLLSTASRSGERMYAHYDVFVSHTWADRELLPVVRALARALGDEGLRVFLDEQELARFARITTTISQSLARSKVLLAFYSAAYPKSRACQWELTAAYLAAERHGDPAERILVVNPESGLQHLHPGELRDALAARPPAPDDQAGLTALARSIAKRVGRVQGPLGAVAPIRAPRWLPTEQFGSTRFVSRGPPQPCPAASRGRSGPGSRPPRLPPGPLLSSGVRPNERQAMGIVSDSCLIAARLFTELRVSGWSLPSTCR
jgi:hypothetical protein